MSRSIETTCERLDTLRVRLDSLCSDRSDILFLVADNDVEKVRAVATSVRDVARALECDEAPVSCPCDGDASYVYGYFDRSPASWDECFYVGKGKASNGTPSHRGRWTDHVRTAFDAGAMHDGAKVRRIRAWFEREHGITGTGEHAAKDALFRLAAGRLVLRLRVYTGQHAEAQAFYVEYFLITHRLGAHALSNDTNGNAKCDDCVALALPGSFDRRNTKHLTIWTEATSRFLHDPHSKRLGNTCRPALLSMTADPFIERLNVLFRPLGVHPHDMSGPGAGRLPPELMLKPNMQVTGAADATITYRLDRDYRLEFRFGATANLVGLSLRPTDESAAAKRRFLAYMDTMRIAAASVGHAVTVPRSLSETYGSRSFVKNRAHWPFYKPYALDAAGRNSKWFDVSDPTVATPGRTNWIEGEAFELNLLQATELVAKAFV